MFNLKAVAYFLIRSTGSFPNCWISFTCLAAGWCSIKEDKCLSNIHLWMYLKYLKLIMDKTTKYFHSMYVYCCFKLLILISLHWLFSVEFLPLPPRPHMLKFHLYWFNLKHLQWWVYRRIIGIGDLITDLRFYWFVWMDLQSRILFSSLKSETEIIFNYHTAAS